jgi:uncharacterized protein YlzI (FlbEa/FlbD family)
MRLTQLNGELIYININHVVHFVRNGEGTVLIPNVTHVSYYVKESLDVILKMIDDMRVFKEYGRLIYWPEA